MKQLLKLKAAQRNTENCFMDAFFNILSQNLFDVIVYFFVKIVSDALYS